MARVRIRRALSVPQLSTAVEDLTGFRWTWQGYDPLDNTLTGYSVLGGEFGAAPRWGGTDGVGGQPVDLATGEATDAGVTITTEVLGATLLALADVVPGEVLAAPTPLTTVLS